MVTVDFKRAITTLKNTNTERHLLTPSTTAAFLTCVTWVNRFKRPSSVFSFGFRYLEKVTPRHIGNSFGEMVVLNHPANVEGFDGNSVKASHQIMRNFVVKVFSAIRNALMFQRNHTPCSAPVRATLLFPGQSLLRQCQLTGGFLQVARVGDGFTIRQSGKVRYAGVKANAQAGPGQRFTAGRLTDQADIPTRSAARDAKLLNFAFHGSGQADAATADARHGQLIAVQRATSTRFQFLAESVVALLAFEARKASFHAGFFQAAKEGLKRGFKFLQNILPDTSQNSFSVGQFSAGLGELARLLKNTESLTALAKVADSLLKRAVPQETAFVKSLFAGFNKRFVRAQFELESFACCVIIRFSHCRLFYGNKGLWSGLGRESRLSLSRLYFTPSLPQSKTTAR